jgi:two-component system, cell cycle sensor histidine kinase and response regulator CckA
MTTTLWKRELRDRAVRTLVGHSGDVPAEWGAAEPANDERERRIQEVELELQNEHLRETQMELETALDRYRNFFEWAPAGYLELDERGTILRANRRARQLLGDDLLARPLAAFVHESGAIDLERHRRRVVGGEAASLELDFGAAEEKHLFLESAPDEDRSGRWRCMLLDRTSQRVLDREAADVAKREAIALAMSGVARHFNDLLFAVTGFTDSALLAVDDHPVAQSQLRRIKNAVAEGARAVRNLFLFDRAPSTRREIFDVNAVVKHGESSVRELVGEEVRVELALSAREARVAGDPSQLEYALLQLSVNARQAMPAGGRLQLATRTVELPPGHARALGLHAVPHVGVTVSDSGPGVDETTRRRAFEPYFTTRPAGAGAGLGLATAYANVRRLGGHIQLESRPGAGATFTILLPLATEHA